MHILIEIIKIYSDDVMWSDLEWVELLEFDFALLHCGPLCCGC